MAVIITSRKFYCEYLGIGGGGTDYLQGSVGDKMRCDIEFYVKWSAENKKLDFLAADDTITNANDLDPSSFIDTGFRTGDTLVVEGTTFNNATFTILTVEERVITVTAGLANESAEDAGLFGTTPVTALDFYYNIIPNTSREDYLSLQDPGALQRYTVNGINAGDIITVKNMFIGSDSFAWVTHTFVDETTGETAQVTIKGQGITADHRQKFIISQTFFITPVWLTEQVNNFAGRTIPALFEDRRSVKHIARMDAKFASTDPEIPHTGSIFNRDGMVAWFNQNAVGSRPEYYIDSIVYTDDITGFPVTVPDLNRKTNVTVVIKSRSNLFTTNTQIVIGALQLPMDRADFINTITPLRKNLFFDRSLLTLSDSATGGEFEATNYQQLKSINLTTFAAGTATIKFSLDFSTFLKDYLKAKTEDNRRDAYWIAIKDPIGIAVTADAQKIALLVEAPLPGYDQDNNALFELIETPKTYEFPNEVEHNATDLAGYEGDPVYTRLKFRLKTSPDAAGVTPTLKTITLQVIATHATKTDFVLEQKIMNTGQDRKLDNAQTIQILEKRGFTTYADDPRNRVNLFRVPANDTGTKAAYELQYGLALRYEYWQAALPQAEGASVDIFGDIENVANRWSDYNNQGGWNLKMRWTFLITGYDGHDTEFNIETDTRSLTGDEDPQTGPVFDMKLQFYTEDGSAQLRTIVEDGITLVRATFEGDFSTMPTFGGEIANDLYVWIFADVEGSSGIFSRQFASTEIPSETDSPWSAPAGDPTATETRALGNLRFNRYDSNRIVAEGLFDISKFKGRDSGTILIYPRIGFLYSDCLILLEDGTPLLLEDGEGTKMEVCA